jgi:predicted O-methyltransferase YrrM
MNIKITLEKLNNIDMSCCEDYTKWKSTHSQYFTDVAGKEHYRLLAYLSDAIYEYSKKPFIDIGTYLGYSALALSKHPSSTIITYDIIDCIPDIGYTMKSVDRIEHRITDCLNEMDTLLNSDLICLDVDPHDGIQEREIFNALKDAGYKGLLIVDDIFINKGMTSFWNNVDLLKYDVSKYGHFSGTGLVVFDPSRFTIELN